MTFHGSPGSTGRGTARFLERLRWFRFYLGEGYPPRLAWRVSRHGRLLVDRGKVEAAKRRSP